MEQSNNSQHTHTHTYLHDRVDVDKVETLDLVGLEAVRALHALERSHDLLGERAV